ncbi:RagB/SusD family nutrient uptake outer membrane protein [Chitinophaga sp. NPDC101104]|uniref:RagB/SusD family nutrient uptake outer membrane protein n=1 Tax=Chitinophaga sp. NPDC101104 TaxID=3390561 RepID=UPI003D082E23
MKSSLKGITVLAAMLLILYGCLQPAARKHAESIAEAMESDSVLMDALVYAAYHEVLIPLYYDACKTDERTDNLYNPFGRAAIDTVYARDWEQAGKIRVCRQLQQVIGQHISIGGPFRLRLLAELEFLKAMLYYAMVQRYGGFVTAAANGEGPLFHPAGNRASLSATYRFTIDAFRRSMVHLPEERNAVRANKTAAKAMILRAALQAAACLPDEKNAYLALALQTGKEILSEGAYSLDQDYAGLFNSFDGSRNSRETIFGICRLRAYTSFQQTLMQDLVVNQANSKMREGYGPLLQDRFDGWSKRYPTQDLTDAYLAVDTDGVAKRWNETSRYKAFRPGLDDAMAVLYANRDRRFYASIVHDSSRYFNSTVFTRDSGNLNTRARVDGNDITPTGYYVRKLLYETKKVWYTDGTDHFLPLIRLGEVYLNLAEASCQAGDSRQAIGYMNKTRTLHGGLPALSMDTPLPVVWDIYQDERRVELFFENDRYWSLIRWALWKGGPAVKELDKSVDAIKISADGRSFKILRGPGEVYKTGWLPGSRFLLPVPPLAGEPR